MTKLELFNELKKLNTYGYSDGIIYMIVDNVFKGNKDDMGDYILDGGYESIDHYICNEFDWETSNEPYTFWYDLVNGEAWNIGE